MATPELPPLRRYDLCLRGYENTMKRADDGDYCDNDDREARERILLARIAELESLWQSAEARYAEADAAAMAHAKRIAELEAVLVKFDERWLMDGELGFCVACGTSMEAGDAHKPECWLTEARAAIDAAREAKP